MEDKIKTLAEWIKDSTYTVVFTGAGMSTEAGIPDFRSKTGLWKKYDPIKMASVDAMHNNSREFYEFYRTRLKILGDAQPHKGHKILAELETQGMIQAIITQNVDGLHHRAGSKRVIELHGTLREAECIKCGRIYEADVLEKSDIPKCKCGGLIKPGVILFGEMLPAEALRQADLETRRSHLFIVIGSSLEVSPANYFPLQAKHTGAKLVFINLDPTDMDDHADLLIRGKAGEVLEKLFITYFRS